MDRVLATHEHGTDLSRGNAGVRSKETDAGNKLGCHGTHSLCLECLGIGAKHILPLTGEGPAAAGICVVTVTVLEVVAGEPGIHLLFQRVQQLVNGKHGVVPDVTGVRSRHFLIPDKQQGIGGMNRQTGVQDGGKLCLFEFRQCGTADFCAIKQGFVGGGAQGVQIPTHTQGQAEILHRVCNGILTGSGDKGGRGCAERRGGIQRLHMEVFHFAPAPDGALRQALVEMDHFRVGVEGGCKVIFAG